MAAEHARTATGRAKRFIRRTPCGEQSSRLRLNTGHGWCRSPPAEPAKFKHLPDGLRLRPPFSHFSWEKGCEEATVARTDHDRSWIPPDRAEIIRWRHQPATATHSAADPLMR